MMRLYKLFSCNVEIQYKNCLFSKAMLFTVLTTVLNIILPFFMAYRSRGFWLRSYSFYEQPTVHFTYNYLLVAETDDPTQPIVCGEGAGLDENLFDSDGNCAEIQVQEHDNNDDGINDILDFKFHLNIPPEKTIASVILLFQLDLQLKTICPLHMQSLAVVNKAFAVPPTGLKYFGDLKIYQTTHLPCLRHNIDTKYNTSLLTYMKQDPENVVDFILENYFKREVITETKTLHLRSQNGHTGTMDIKISLRIPEIQVQYIPSLLQEIKWAWPQYLSLVVVFYWAFNNIKRFVFNNRLLMAWEIVPWKK